MQRVSRRARGIGWLVLVSLASLAFTSSATAQTEGGPNGPSRDDIASFFSSIRADLYTCANGWHGSVEVEITFSRDGRATSVEVEASEGALADTVRRCVASVVRAARIRAFSEPAAIVEYTFRL